MKQNISGQRLPVLFLVRSLPKIEEKASDHRLPVLLGIKREKEKGGEEMEGGSRRRGGVGGGGTDKSFVCPPPLLAVAWLAFLL